MSSGQSVIRDLILLAVFAASVVRIRQIWILAEPKWRLLANSALRLVQAVTAVILVVLVVDLVRLA